MKIQFVVIIILSFFHLTAMATKLNEYNVTDNGNTVHHGGSKIQNFNVVDKSRWRGLRHYGAAVEADLVYYPEGKPSYTKKITIWFGNKSDAQKFKNVISSNEDPDLYYNFSKNPFNSTGQSSGCILQGLICRDYPVTIINWSELDGGKLWVNNKNSGAMIKANDSDLEDEIAVADPRVLDGARDGNRKQSSPDHQVVQDSRSISV